ncbi:sensor histidine kinase [Paenibacillus alginolyticus]|uniref:Sensor histidine kinase n=1 Tax=Paenibacillus alginolyticus TaxID=59839 RepID=A0ABT4GBZ0_9BACL|nr:sensor histidine kinase [Paenibacillus alginolyticus]MCY9693685.1 sensor histidine kinase [Paenibacillus alginolyticus]MEC0145585.1 sensor histidine kinase [Paenibacillus alginolyticus]
MTATPWNLNRVKDFRIRTKIFLSNMIIILFISSAIGGVAIYASTKFIESNTRDLSMQVIHQVSDNIEIRAKEAFSSSVYVLSDSNIRQIAAEQGEQVTVDNYPAFRSRMEFLLAQYGNGNPYMNAIMIQTQKGQVYWWENKKGLDRTLNHEDVTVMTNNASDYLKNHEQSISWSPSLRKQNEVFLIRDFVDLSQVDRSLGTIVISIDSDYFLSLGSNSSIIKQNNVAILNPLNELLAGGGTPGMDNLISRSLSYNLKDNDASMAIVDNAEGGSHLFVQERTSTLGWRVLCFIPMSELLSNTRVLVFVIALVSLLAVLISTGIAVLLSNSTTRNIKILEQTMRRVEDGNFDVRIIPLGRDEIGSLSIRFNFMLSRINDLINTVYKEQIAKQQAEFTVLMSQINPHFLYNTLGTVKWYARMNQQAEIEQMVTSVIELLKSSVRRVGEFHSLEQEINQLKNYIYIQKIGYGDAFHMDYEVDERLLESEVPYFILQPLVENAILHGIEMSKGSGRIVLHARIEEMQLLLIVEDNGIGMEAEQALNLLNAATRKESVPGVTSIGIHNVNERIQLYYGDTYGLSYESALGLGTKAIVRIPHRTHRQRRNEHVERHDR